MRVVTDGLNISVRAYKYGKPANGYSHNVSIPTAIKINSKFPINAIQDLIDTAIRDVKDKMWDKYLLAIDAQRNKGI